VLGWRFIDASGAEVGRSPRFGDADAADDWLGAAWRDLRDNGVEEVVLYEHDRRLFRMGLGEESP
jgi:hypothetical protein